MGPPLLSGLKYHGCGRGPSHRGSPLAQVPACCRLLLRAGAPGRLEEDCGGPFVAGLHPGSSHLLSIQAGIKKTNQHKMKQKHTFPDGERAGAGALPGRLRCRSPAPLCGRADGAGPGGPCSESQPSLGLCPKCVLCNIWDMPHSSSICCLSERQC